MNDDDDGGRDVRGEAAAGRIAALGNQKKTGATEPALALIVVREDPYLDD